MTFCVCASVRVCEGLFVCVCVCVYVCTLYCYGLMPEINMRSFIHSIRSRLSFSQSREVEEQLHYVPSPSFTTNDTVCVSNRSRAHAHAVLY